jgi:hypothetical protein
MRKNILTILCCYVFLVTLAACGSNNGVYVLKQTIVAQQTEIALLSESMGAKQTEIVLLSESIGAKQTEIALLSASATKVNVNNPYLALIRKRDFRLTPVATISVNSEIARDDSINLMRSEIVRLQQTSTSLQIAVDVLITQPTPAPAQIVPKSQSLLTIATRDVPRETEVSLQQTKIALDTAALKVAKEQAYNASYANYLACMKLNEVKFMACTQPSRP